MCDEEHAAHKLVKSKRIIDNADSIFVDEAEQEIIVKGLSEIRVNSEEL